MTRSRDFAKGATRSEFDYTATAGQTTFTGNDNDSESLAYTAGQIDVYLNGSHLNQTDDYVATNGTSVVLQSGAAAGDILHVVAYGSFNVANVVATRDLEGNEFILDDDGDTTITADTDDQIDIKIAGADDFQFTANTFTAQSGSTIAAQALTATTITTSSTIDVNGNELILDADADTSITADTDDQIDIKIGGADDFNFTANTFNVLDGSKVLIGGQSSDSVGGATCNLQLEGTSTADSSISLKCNTNGTTAPTLRFGKSRGTAVGSDTVVQSGDELGVIVFAGADGTDTETQGAVIIAAVDGTPGGNDLPTRLMFNTTADGAASTTERMRLVSTGEILFGKTSNNFGTAGGTFNDTGSKNGALELICNGEPSLALNRLSSDGSIIVFHKDGSSGGSITTTASSTAYNTTSDYRLKENVDYSFDATARVKQLKPCRFNFIADGTDTLVDGFIAHEVSSIVPEAITGDKDATRTATNVVKNADGTLNSEGVTQAEWTKDKADGIYANNTTWSASMSGIPVMQQIDQAKLVPLLVKTIQELEARIKTLEDA